MYPIDSIVLYVEDIAKSRAFYTEVLECEAIELSPTFVSIVMEGGSKLELKQRAQSIPPATITGGGTELSIRVPNIEMLHDLFEQWKSKGVRFLQEPVELVFGVTFVALDPDEHRLRVFVQK
jgi:catechol 2,3-dioxygenase-like lactoylglutathione lyase family enzyme